MEAVSASRLEVKTGFRTLYEAIQSAKEHGDGMAIWYCLEVVRPMVSGLVSQYLGYARSKNISSLVSRHDLEQEAFEHIIRSIQRFEPPAGASEDDILCRKAWNGYSSLVAKNPVREAYSRSLGPVKMPDWALKIASRLNRAILVYEDEGIASRSSDATSAWSLAAPDARQIAARAGIEYSKVKRFIDTGLHFLPGERYMPLGDEIFGDESVVSGDPGLYFTQDQEKLMAAGMQLLNSRQKFVISRLYGLDGRPGTYKSIAKVLDLDPEDVKALEKAAITQLKEGFMEDGLG